MLEPLSRGGGEKWKVPPTLNISWVLATSICIWFLFIHAPPYLLAKDYIQPLLYVHLFGAYSVYLACVHNTLLTPSTFGGAARPFHIWIGRAGLVLGVFGFITGFILTWFIYDASNDLGFSIGITYGGVAQMHVQIMGYRAIRRYQDFKSQIEAGEYENQDELIALEDEQDTQLSIHIVAMINLFALACGIPALIRVGAAIGNAYLPLLFVGAYGISYLMAKPIMNKLKASRAAARGEGLTSEESELNQNSFGFDQYFSLSMNK